MSALESRFRFALRWSLSHLVISAAVAALAAGVVFGLWYPAPWQQMLGIAGIFGVVVVADVVCGPLLTLVLASPRKSRRERWVDLSLVALVQLMALAYGLHSVFEARPVALAFETDRLLVVTANEVQLEQLADAPAGFRTLPFAGLLRVGVRKARSREEYLASFESSLQGVSPGMRPGWWLPLDAVVPELLAKARPIDDLMKARPNDARTLEDAVLATRLPQGQLRFLPLTSSKSQDWVALLTAQGEMVGYAQVDGFIEP